MGHEPRPTAAEDYAWKILTALAYFGPLYAVEIKRALSPGKGIVDKNVRKKFIDYSNNPNIDAGLIRLEEDDPKVISYEKEKKKRLLSVQSSGIEFGEIDSKRRFKLIFPGVVSHFVDENCDFSEEVKEQIAEAIQKGWDGNYLFENRNPLGWAQRWTQKYVKKGFDDVLIESIIDWLTLRIEAELIGGKMKIESGIFPNWQKISDDEIYFLAIFCRRNFWVNGSFYRCIYALLSKNQNKFRTIDANRNPLILGQQIFIGDREVKYNEKKGESYTVKRRREKLDSSTKKN